MQFSPKETSNTFFSVFWGQEENMLMLKVLLLQGYCVKYCLNIITNQKMRKAYLYLKIMSWVLYGHIMEEVTSICKQLVSWLAELILWQSMKKWLLLYIYKCIYIIKKALLRESDGQVNCVLGIIILVLPTV